MRILIQLLKNSKWACLALVLSFSTTTSYAQWSDITGFEQGWGIWNDGGSDAYRLYEANSVLPGSYCARLRDNSGVSSSIYTNNLNLGGHSSVNIQFQYLAESMEHGEDFFLEYSSNGGSTYEKIETYTRGVHFNNGEKKSENVTVNKNFNDQCRFRFRCDASSNYDMIYLDDIKINAGGTGGNGGNGGTTTNCHQKKLWIKNNGSCPVNVYWWQNSGDVYYTTLNAGHQWDVSSYEGHKWRVVDTNNDWNHLLYDQSYTMNGDCDQTWNIHPDYCNQPAQCNQKKLWIKNNGSCPVNVYWWQNSGDVYYTTLNAGHQWDVSTYEGHKWRVVDTNNDWNHLLYDHSYTVNGDCDQTWNIHPDYCNPVYDCPNLNANIGDSCNDGNANTTNDVINHNCHCVGTPVGCTGRITGFSIHHHTGTFGSIHGKEYCTDKFQGGDISIRAHVTGAHQSLKFTIQTPQGTWTNTENHETYDSKNVWATAAGTYRITADLYSHDHLGGTKCDSKTVTFVVKDCTPQFDCPNLNANIGDSCNDGNSNTINDVVNHNCHCVGTPVGCSGRITGFSIKHNTGTFGSINGKEYCHDKFAGGDISIRAHVTGSHQSMKFTIQTPQGTWTNTENHETYDSKYFWATAPGTYRVTAKLYSHDHLGGTECDSETVTFTIKDCNGNTGGNTGGACSHKLVHYQGFESGWGKWNDGGSDCYRNYEPNTSAVGNYCVRLRDNSGHSSSTSTDNLNFNGVQECKVDFMYIGESMESGEDFMMEYSTNGGSNWTTVKKWESGRDFNNGQKKSESVKFNANFTNNTKIRFRCDASSNYDIIYLDEIKVYACGGSWLTDDNDGSYSVSQTTNTVNMVNQNSNTTSTATIHLETMETEATVEMTELRVYPNPSTHTLNIEGLSGQTYDVYDISGQRIIKASNEQALDISGLQNGTYMLRVLDGQMIRFIKM